MRRFLIFIVLFPAIALAGLFAFISIGIGTLPDNPEAFTLVGWAYVAGVIPALLCAIADLFFGKTSIPRIVGTAAVGYGLGLLVALTFFDWGLVGRILAFALIGGVPAAVCSWVSRKVA